MKKEFIYLLRTYGVNGKTLIKLGYTSNLKVRLKQYKHSNPLIKVINSWEIHRAKDLESLFHSMYKAESGNEWYSEDKLKIIETIMNNPEIFLSVITVSSNFKEVWFECKNKNKNYIKNACNMYPYLSFMLKKVNEKKMEQLKYDYYKCMDYVLRYLTRHGIEDIYM